jgi:integrase
LRHEKQTKRGPEQAGRQATPWRSDDRSGALSEPREQSAHRGGNRRAAFRLKPYSIAAKPHLKFAVVGREAGKRRRWYFATKGEAAAHCELKNQQARKQGTEGAEFPSWLRVMASECHARLTEHKCTIKDATEHLLAHIAATKKSCTASELVEKLIAAKKTDGASQRYLEDLQSRLNRFAADFDGQVIATITSAKLDDWLRDLNASPVTRNNYRRLLTVAFNYAVQRGFATNNPAENTSKAKEKTGAPGILTVSETARLLESTSADVLPYIAIGAFAGLRRAELERLDWQDVHFDSDLIEVTAEKAKTARRRFVKMQPNLREWLLPVRKRKGEVVRDNFRKRFDEARTTAGIAEWPDNALRHSFASYHLAHFKDAAALALDMGHMDSGMIFNHYRELVKPKDAERYWNIRPATQTKVVPLTANA